MNPLAAFMLRYFSRLRYPWLFALTGALFGLDLLVPDVLPFADEILLGLATLLLATRRKERGPGEPPPRGARRLAPHMAAKSARLRRCSSSTMRKHRLVVAPGVRTHFASTICNDHLLWAAS